MDEDRARVALATNAPGDEFVQFIRALVEAGKLPDTGALLAFLEKPWHWATEFAAWDTNGRPLDHSEAGWDAWLEAIE